MTQAEKAVETTAKKAKPAKAAAKASKTTVAASFPYAVIRTGGKQYRVGKGDMILVEKLEVEAGSTWTADDVLFVAKAPGQFTIGKPTVKGAKVSFEVLQQTLGPKVLIRHARRRQNSQKTLGHRQQLTRILVKEISA
jgi:large subunit ribosomal protein L21